MADTITDGRTIVDDADDDTPYDNLAGTAAGTFDSEIGIQGNGSVGAILTDTETGILFDAGSEQDWSNNVFYIWVNCGIVGLLATKAAQGFKIRFCGDNVANFREYDVAGSDNWPVSIQGGWVQFVVDIEASPSRTGGTPPSTTGIRYVGWAGITATIMPKHVDNTWIDEIRRLPDGSPGILVQGRNGGATAWTFADIASELGVGVGTFVDGPGGSFVCRTSIQFGANDSVTHLFEDTNQIVLFDDQEFAPVDLYELSALGNSGGTTTVTLGVKTGSGDAATGAQGVIFSAASGGVRFDMDFNDPDLDGINFYGCTFIHGGDFLLDDPAVSFISTSFLDCTSALISNSEMLRVTVIDANTADAVAFMTTDDLGDIVFSKFEFSDGHAVELTTPRIAVQTSKGNVFAGYGIDTSNDAALFNDSGGLVTIGVTELGSGTTFRNGSGASTVVNQDVTIKVTVKDESGTLLVGVQVAIFRDDNGVELMNLVSDSNGEAETTFNFSTDVPVSVRARKGSGNPHFIVVRSAQTIIDEGLDVILTMRDDDINEAPIS